jgi:hypothetical protein
LPTYNDKIMIARGEMYNYEEIDSNICELIASAALFDKVEVVKRMKAIVPEYKSMNSSYEKLDKKENDTSVKMLDNTINILEKGKEQVIK